MKKTVIILTMIYCVYALTAYAQDAPVDTVLSDGGNVNVLIDTVQSDDDSLDVFDGGDIGEPDSAAAKKTDSLDDFDSDDDLEIAEALPDSAASAQKLGGVRRGYDRKRQVKLAIVMMVFIIFALTTSQSFNPN